MIGTLFVMTMYYFTLQKQIQDVKKPNATFVHYHVTSKTNNGRILTSNPNYKITMVTAFMDIGSFGKGSQSNVRTPKKYCDWMETFRNFHVPLVAYLDKKSDIELFKTIRSSLPKDLTKLVLINKEKLWAFSLRNQIQKIYSSPGYPKHLPNTVNPNYSCAVLAKYEFVARSVNENPFNTLYFMWADIGLYRNLDKRHNYTVVLPVGLADNEVAYGVVNTPNKYMSVRDIFLNNRVWVAGGLFVAKTATMLKWTAIYRNAAESFIKKSLMSSDEQVVYALMAQHKWKNDLPVRVNALLNTNLKRYLDNYFHLPYEILRYKNGSNIL